MVSKLQKVIPLYQVADSPKHYRVTDSNYQAFFNDSEEMIKHIRAIKRLVNNCERIYIRYILGPRKGSIAYIRSINYCVAKKRTIHSGKFRKFDMLLEVDLSWDNKRSVIQESLIISNVPTAFEWLVGYDGPTVWVNKDKKLLAKEILETYPQFDMRGNVIKVGDKVIFINSRYGKAARLDYGVIKELKVSIQYDYYYNRSHDIVAVISSVRNDNGKEIISNIKAISESIIVINNTDLIDDMLMAKLES